MEVNLYYELTIEIRDAMPLIVTACRKFNHTLILSIKLKQVFLIYRRDNERKTGRCDEQNAKAQKTALPQLR